MILGFDMEQVYSSDVAFTQSVKAVQSRKGSRRAYAAQEEGGSWQTEISDDLKGFVEGQTSIFLGTASADGQPYIQHRGGPAGFLQVLDARTIGFVDYAGNRQFITSGNLAENDKAYLFMIDYVHQRRVKLWGTARVVEGDAELTARLASPGYRARAEQVILFTVTAWDRNCPQHIPQRMDAVDVATLLAAREARIAELEAALAAQ